MQKVFKNSKDCRSVGNVNISDNVLFMKRLSRILYQTINIRNKLEEATFLSQNKSKDFRGVIHSSLINLAQMESVKYGIKKTRPKNLCVSGP